MTSVRRTPPSAIAADPSWKSWITHAAFLIALIVMVARLTTPDALRDPWEPTPGGAAIPADPGPATALVFDLFACLPAVLVLIRRAIDADFRLAPRLSHALLFGLTSLAMLSTFWSADRFAAIVTASHFFAAGCLLWAMSQLVRSAGQFRLVCAVALGLLLVLVAQSVMYHFVDVPENVTYWNEKKFDVLKEHGWAPNSYAAIQFEHKLTSGEEVGFFNSPNTFAAVGVLLFTACVGIGIQKLRDREPMGWIGMPIAASIALVWILMVARSKTAAVTPVLGIGIFCLFMIYRQRLRQQHAAVYGVIVGLVVFAMIAVIGHATYHHGLFPGHFSNSLDFRWKYWIASAGVFKSHPWGGVGWANYGLYYLAHRLPEAAEEIKDPHNFLVRFFVELGLLGGSICIAWVLRVAWEITLPTTDDAPASLNDVGTMSIKSAVTVVILGMVLSVIANIDFNQQLPDILTMLMKPVLYLLAMLLGTLAGAMLSPEVWSLDDRPAPVVFYCTLIGLGLFLLHNLIDFSWFEPGAMFVFMALIGASLGMAPINEQKAPRRSLAIGGSIFAISAWIATALLLVLPVILAEQLASDANESIRTSRLQQARDSLQSASNLVPYNNDYLFREAQVLIRMHDIPNAQLLLSKTRKLNPMDINSYALDANLQLSRANPDFSAIRSDFETITKLNPNDVSFHTQFAQALEKFGLYREAREQYQLALNANNALPAGEPKRLPQNEVEQLQQKSQQP